MSKSPYRSPAPPRSPQPPETSVGERAALACVIALGVLRALYVLTRGLAWNTSTSIFALLAFFAARELYRSFASV